MKTRILYYDVTAACGVQLICAACVTAAAAAGIRVSASPDGQFITTCWLTRPFSTAVPAGRFPVTVQLWTKTGQFVKEIAALPLAEDIPIAFNSCRTGTHVIVLLPRMICMHSAGGKL